MSTKASDQNISVHETRQKPLSKNSGLNDIKTIESVLSDAIKMLFREQRQDGTWMGNIMFNAWTVGMYAVLHKELGLEGEPTETLDWLEKHRTGQRPDGTQDGTWGIVDHPSLHLLEATIMSEIALEIWGRGRKQEAWDFIDEQSTARLANSISLTDPFTQIFSVIASKYAPSGTPPYYSVNDMLAPPIEMLLIPGFVKTSLPKLFAAWGQDAIPAIMIMTTLLKNKEPSMFQQILLKKAEAMLLRAQTVDGSWYDTALPSMACTMAMHILGYKNDHKVMRKSIAFVKGLIRQDGYVVRYRLPIWDTALSVVALRTAGVSSADPGLKKAGQCLIDGQALNGGIPFQKENSGYPDTDDTSIALLALDDLNMGELEQQKLSTIKKGLRWLLYMQGDDGGWAAFSKNQAKKVKGSIPFFKDDPPTADVTGHVISSLKLASKFDYKEEGKEAVQRGIQWVQTMQMSRGEWFGRWGLTYTYGTTAVLQSLYDVGEPMDRELVYRAVDYFLSTQQKDGGWGEGISTYYNPEAKDDAKSTIEQTAWSLLGLLVAQQTPKIQDAIERGVKHLIDSFNSKKGWGQGEYVVGALWVYKNTLYPLIWSIWALGLYLKLKGGTVNDL